MLFLACELLQKCCNFVRKLLQNNISIIWNARSFSDQQRSIAIFPWQQARITKKSILFERQEALPFLELKFDKFW